MQIDNTLLLDSFISLANNIVIHAVVILAIIDIFTGMSAGLKCRELSSTKGLNGIIKHMCVLALILLVYPYMRILNLQMYANLFVCFYIISYAISILENLTELGAPVPSFLVRYLSKVKSQLDNGKE